MVSLAGSMGVEWLEVHCAARLTIMFSCDNHPALPACRGVQWHSFENAKFNISVQAGLHRILPMQGHYTGAVHCHRPGSGVNMQL